MKLPPLPRLITTMNFSPAFFFKPAEFSQEQAELLFCKGTDVNSVFDALDKDGNGKVRLKVSGMKDKNESIGYER